MAPDSNSSRICLAINVRFRQEHSNTKEIDVFVEENDVIHPLEIKFSSNPDCREAKKYGVLDKPGLACGPGGIICMCPLVMPIDEANCFIPDGML